MVQILALAKAQSAARETPLLSGRGWYGEKACWRP